MLFARHIKGIALCSCAEGNMDAVGEHALGNVVDVVE